MTEQIKNLSFGFLGHHPVQELTKLAQAAEAYGFSSVWIAEDYFYAGAFSVAGALAMATSTIGLGIGVINPFTRHPVLSAMEAASLDSLSQGRAIVAVGAANRLWMETQLGIPYERPITAVRECAQIMKNLISQGNLTYHGTIFQVENVELDFARQRPDLPIYLGVKGDRALEIAGEVSDGLLISAGCTLEYIYYAKERLARGAKRAGRRPTDIKIAAYLPCCIRSSHQEAVELMRPHVRRYLGLHGDKPILTCAGFSPEQLRPFREAFLAGSVCNNPVPDDMVERIVVVGTAEECRNRILAYQQAGVEMPICFEVAGLGTAMDQLQALHSMASC